MGPLVVYLYLSLSFLTSCLTGDRVTTSAMPFDVESLVRITVSPRPLAYYDEAAAH